MVALSKFNLLCLKFTVYPTPPTTSATPVRLNTTGAGTPNNLNRSNKENEEDVTVDLTTDKVNVEVSVESNNRLHSTSAATTMNVSDEHTPRATNPRIKVMDTFVSLWHKSKKKCKWQ